MAREGGLLLGCCAGRDVGVLAGVSAPMMEWQGFAWKLVYGFH